MTLAKGELKKSRIYICIMIVLTIYRICLFLMIPYNAVGGSGYDDQYMLRLADYIGKGWWLGDYDYTTLVKGVSYPLFVALSNFFCVPYSFSLGAFFVFASLLFYYATKNVTSNPIVLMLSYLSILYSPVGFSDSVTQHLYRNALVFPSAVIVISSLLLVYFTRQSFRKVFFLWLCILGISFGFFYYIREDSIWLVPLVVGALMLTAIWLIWFSHYSRKEIAIRCASLILTPIVLFLAITFCYKALNYHKYEVFMTNDRTSGAFADFTGTLVRLQDSNADDDIWISRNKLERVCNELPSMKDDTSVFLEYYDNWCSRSEWTDLPGDISFWALREAINCLGFCKDAPSFQEYCSRLNSELLQAVDRGAFQFDNALYFSRQSGGISWEDIPSVLAQAAQNVVEDSLYHGAVASCEESSGYLPYIRYMESVTSTNTIHPSENLSVIYGWVLFKNEVVENPDVLVVDGEHKYYSELSTVESSTQSELGYPSNHSIYFHCSWDNYTNLEEVRLQFWNNGKLVFEGNPNSIESDTIQIYIDFASSAVIPDDYQSFHTRVVELSNFIISLYKKCVPIVLIVSIIAFLSLWIIWFRKKDWRTFEPVIILTGLILTAFIAALGVTIFTGDWLSYAIWYYSSSGVLASMQCFEIFSLCLIWNAYKNSHAVVMEGNPSKSD